MSILIGLKAGQQSRIQSTLHLGPRILAQEFLLTTGVMKEAIVNREQTLSVSVYTQEIFGRQWKTTPLKPFQNDEGILNCAFSFNSTIYWGPASMSALSLPVGIIILLIIVNLKIRNFYSHLKFISFYFPDSQKIKVFNSEVKYLCTHFFVSAFGVSVLYDKSMPLKVFQSAK